MAIIRGWCFAFMRRVGTTPSCVVADMTALASCMAVSDQQRGLAWTYAYYQLLSIARRKSLRFKPRGGLTRKIGRASCRERVRSSVGARALIDKGHCNSSI